LGAESGQICLLLANKKKSISIRLPAGNSNVERERRMPTRRLMANSTTSKFIKHLRSALLVRDEARLADGQLLECFLAQRDDAAFAALVARHSSMVWGVCRRVLNHHDAEDAFQATFLVLIRKAASIEPKEMVGNWLYGVAFQTAMKARSVAIKRKKREKLVAGLPESAVEEQDVWHDLEPLIDKELTSLPDKYRCPIVLCDLEGKTRKKAAQQLGWPEGTVAGRLAIARKMLARRLARRGLALSGGALVTALMQNAASACVSPAVLTSTIQAGTLLAAGQAPTVGAISAKVAALTEGVLKAMFLNKLKIAVAALLVLGTITFTTARLASCMGDDATTFFGDYQKRQETPKGKEPGQSSGRQGGENAIMNELEKLQGTWVMISVEEHGNSVSGEGIKKKFGVTMVIKGDEFNLKLAVNKSELRGRLTIDPAKEPKTMDWSALRPEDERALTPPPKGIYRLEGDTFTFCYGEERPTDFWTKHQRMYVFKREKR
jgi:RNA polymerase sigma factor (sigma-70 family)